MATSVARNPL